MTHDNAVDLVRKKFPKQEYLSLKSVQEFLDFASNASVYERAKKGHLQIVRLPGGEPRVPVSSLIRYIRNSIQI